MAVAVAHRAARRASRWRPFTLAAVPAAILVAAITVWLGFTIGGDTATTAVSDIGQAIPALAAAASCGWAAHRAIGRMRLAWGLLGLSAFSWGAGEVVWSYYTVVRNVAVPFPSAADAGFLIAVPFAVAGVLAFPAAAGRGATRWRAVLDGAMVALSLLFVSWALGLGGVYHQSQSSLLAQWIGLAYPIGDIVIATVLFIAVRRSLPEQRGRLLLLLAGLGANAFSDSTFAFLTASGSYLTSSYLFSDGWIIGYTFVALAPLWPERVATITNEEGPITLARTMLPWLGLVAVAVTALVLTLTHHPLDPFLAVPGAGLVIVVMASQLLTYRDSLNLLHASRLAEAQLKERTILLDEIIEHEPQGVARVDRNLRITNVNARMSGLFRAGGAVLAGSPLAQHLPAAEVTRVFEAFGSGSTGVQDTIEADSPARRADGSEFWVHWSATAVRRAGAIDYFLVMVDDITAEHSAQEAALRNLANLERLSQLKSEFMSMVSHEFRTALVGIQGFSEMIRDEDMPMNEVHTFAGDINKDAERLNRMITEMLDLDRMEAGRMNLNLKPCDLHAIVRDAVAHAEVTTSKHTFRSDLAEALPPVSVDADRILQVLTNLLSNAVKYSPDGGTITVTSKVGEGEVQVSVADQGLGIPAQYINRLFGRYERFENNNVAKIMGTGLGLAITRQILELHGGRIWVESTVGSGSTFSFSLPLH